jgi:cytochrome c oxidase subunit 1
MAVGFILMAFYLMDSLLNGKKAPNNPWGALTLEWQTQSPPLTENFIETPVVTRGPYDFGQEKRS